jgi:peptidoglycan hydrolase-like protein with peptidoglycan-binding domain
VYLNPAKPAPATAAAPASGPAAAAVAAATPGTDVELEYWRSVKDSKKPEELNSYVAQYPNGQFKALALSRMAALENGTLPDKEKSDVTRNLTAAVDPATFTDDSTQLTEDQIGLDKGQRRDVQRRLTGLGFDTKATGVFTDDTRTVLKRWQAARGYPVTGYLNKLQHKALLTEIVSASGGGGRDDDSSSSSEDRPRRHSSGGGGGGGGGGRRYHGGGGGPPNIIGGMIGGMFR